MNLGTATTLHDGNMVYHDTMICESLGNGKTRLNSGGWRTATTKKRMNQYAEMMGHEWRVKQVDGEWFIGKPGQPLVCYAHLIDGASYDNIGW